MKKIFLVVNGIFLSLFLQAQTQSGTVSDLTKGQKTQVSSPDNPTGFRKENLRIGGSFGAAFGNVTIVDISPTVGYQFYKMFQAGVGAVYNYYAYDGYNNERIKNHIFGGLVYGEFSPLRQIFLRAEYGMLNYTPYMNDEREWVAYPLVGGGVFCPWVGMRD